MKTFTKILLWFSLVILPACTPYPFLGDLVDYSSPGSLGGISTLSPSGSLVSGLTHKERDKVMKDTITPPDNPMNEVPYKPGTHAFRGVLELKEFDGRLYCAIRSVNNEYYLTDNGASYLFRLNHPLLSDCAVGDTIVVTAKPMKLVSDFSLAAYYVQPNK